MPNEAIEFPVIDGYSAQWDIQPLDKVYVYDPDTNDSDLACYSADDTQHTQPVQIDRFGTLPELNISVGVDVTIALCNRYGVERYRASRIGGTWYKTINYIFPDTASITITTFAASIGVTSYLLLEDGASFLLLEDGTSKLILG